MTRSDLAKKLKITPKAVKYWEDDVSFPSISNLRELSVIFGVSSDYLLGLGSRDAIYIDMLDEKDKNRIRAMVQTFIDITLDNKKI